MIPYTGQGDQDHQQGHRDNDAHGEMRTDACAEEFMMDVVLVGEEGIPVVTNTCHDHPDDIQHRDEHRGQANDQHLTGEGTPCPTGHVDKEEADQIAQGQGPRVAHEDLLTRGGIAKDIEDPERQEDAQHAKGHNHKEVLVAYDRSQSQGEESHKTDACRQTIEAIDEVDGIGDVDHHEDRQRDAYPSRERMDEEESREVVDPQT